jgi:spore coat polysaccharide biosynthesis predicted glycosyltransferase SpsG
MIAFCVESSHKRGMGHLFRSCILARAFAEAGHSFKFYVGDHLAGIELLKRRGIPFEVVPLEDYEQDWERAAILKDGIDSWIFDRHRTDIRSTSRIKAMGIPLTTLDDRGSGAAAADLHFAALTFEADERLEGKRILGGLEYLIIDPEIRAYRRLRTSAEKLVVTLGGADTYGATAKVMNLLSNAGRRATVIVGPAFAHEQELARESTPNFTIKRNVPSLLQEFARHDVAITGGGMTPFEANASGLPCIVVANEDFEIPIGRALEKLGGALFAGHHSKLDRSLFSRDLPVPSMSKAALERIPIDGAARIVEIVLSI